MSGMSEPRDLKRSDAGGVLRERVAELERQVRRHRKLYYNGTPEISDLEFDAIEEELRRLDPTSPVLAEVGATPAGALARKEAAARDRKAGGKGQDRTVGASTAGLPLKRHKIPMGSLDKVPEDRLDAWAQKAGPLFLVQE